MNGTPVSWSSRHSGPKSGWVGDLSRGGTDGTSIALHPRSIASRGRGRRELGIGERHVPDREQPAVGRAEVDHRPVVGARAAVEHFEIIGRELGRGERTEDELRVEAEQVECPGAFDRVPRAERVPALGSHHVALELRRGDRVAPARFSRTYRVVGERAGAAELQRADAVAHVAVRRSPRASRSAP